MLAPNRIRFCGVFSNELNMPDLIMDCAFDSDNSEISTFLTREAVASESYDGRSRRISSFKYTENFAPKFSFLKKGFGDFTQDEIRSLLKYLTQRDTTGLLETYDDDSNIISWASIGNFSEIQLYKIANKRVVGVTAVWDSISPFCMSDLYTVTKTIVGSGTFTINIDTDDNQPVYPRVTIKNPATNITFRNTYTDLTNNGTILPSVTIKNNLSSETIVLDGANKIVSSNRAGGRIFGDDFVDWRWLELRDGKNEITIEGNCTVTLEWRTVKKIGEY